MKDVNYEYEGANQLVSLWKAYITHVLNHCLHFIDTVEANDKALDKPTFVSQVYQLAKDVNSDKSDSDSDDDKPNDDNKGDKASHEQWPLPVDDHKDQGFTTPWVLILCPFRSIAYEII